MKIAKYRKGDVIITIDEDVAGSVERMLAAGFVTELNWAKMAAAYAAKAEATPEDDITESEPSEKKYTREYLETLPKIKIHEIGLELGILAQVSLTKTKMIQIILDNQ